MDVSRDSGDVQRGGASDIGSAGAFSVMAVIFGLIYGAVFGWAVTSSVVKALDEAGGR